MLPDNLRTIFDQLEYDTTQTILAHLRDVGRFTASDLHRLEQLQRMGRNQVLINRKIARALERSEKEVFRLYQKSAKEYYNSNEIIYQKTGTHWIPYDENFVMQQFVEAVAVQTTSQFRNITGSLGFVDQYGKPMTMQNYYQQVLDYSISSVMSGTTDYNSAIRRSVRELSDSGMQWVDYESGWRNRARVAADRALFTGMAQVRERINYEAGQAFGADGMEISWHSGFRPTHNFGGLQFTMAEYLAKIAERLRDYNCRHRAFPIVIGISEPSIPPQEFARLNRQEQIEKVWRGKPYNRYDQEQRQRRFESDIRIQKDRIVNFGKVGDQAEVDKARKRLASLQNNYRSFSRTMGIPTQPKRAQTYGYDVATANKTNAFNRRKTA